MHLRWFGKKKTENREVLKCGTLREERFAVLSILKNLLSKSQENILDECAKLELSMITNNMACDLFAGSKKKNKIERFAPKEMRELEIEYIKKLHKTKIGILAKLDTQETFDAKKFAKQIQTSKKRKFGIFNL